MGWDRMAWNSNPDKYDESEQNCRRLTYVEVLLDIVSIGYFLCSEICTSAMKFHFLWFLFFSFHLSKPITFRLRK